MPAARAERGPKRKTKETEKDTNERFLGLEEDGRKETIKETAKQPRAGLYRAESARIKRGGPKPTA